MFDGHGGKEVAKYVENHSVKILDAEIKRQGNVSKGLKESFFEVDRKLD